MGPVSRNIQLQAIYSIDIEEHNNEVTCKYFKVSRIRTRR